MEHSILSLAANTSVIVNNVLKGTSVNVRDWRRLKESVHLVITVPLELLIENPFLAQLVFIVMHQRQYLKWTVQFVLLDIFVMKKDCLYPKRALLVISVLLVQQQLSHVLMVTMATRHT
jgi:hypothetical protein